MSFKTTKLKFTVPAAEEAFYTDIKRRVNAYFAQRSRYANGTVAVKAVLYVMLVAGAYAWLLNAGNYLQLQFAYWALGFSSILCALNFAHDAAHHSLTGKRKIDNLIFEV